MTAEEKTFEDLGLSPWLLESLNHLSIRAPTEIQVACVPPALEGIVNDQQRIEALY
jgi:superfamily II DNA/RNA helicase